VSIFGTIDGVIGKKLPDNGRTPPSPLSPLSSSNASRERRVIGIIAPYRKSGEFSGVTHMVFLRKSFTAANGPFTVSGHMSQAPEVRTIVVAVHPGTSPAFEAKLSEHLHAVAPDVSFRLKRMEQMRRLMLRQRATPLVVLSVVALFLISMVGLGLTGVLWQTVTRRTREIGLRRALGATGHGVRAQVLAEVALLATLAVVAGVIVIVQLPLLGVMHFVTSAELSSGLAGALAVIYVITLLCGAYPSWLASRIEPAEALRYE
jgi:putative ABC transport system permease protein